MAKMHAFAQYKTFEDEKGLLDIEQTMETRWYVTAWAPNAEQLIDIIFWQSVEDVADRNDVATTHYEIDIPDTVDVEDEEAVAAFYDHVEFELDWKGATVVNCAGTAQRLHADSAERNAVKFWDYNDCRDDEDALLPATHWFFQTGNRWIARATETLESWWAGVDLEPLPDAARARLVRPINEVPTSGSLHYDNDDGIAVEISAAEYHKAA